MLFPKNRMRFTTSYQGKTEPEGWIVLDLTGVELEGVNRLYLSMEDIQKLKQGGDTASDRLKQARSLLGGPDDE
ncbi:MAG TPA: hypothetical protein VKU00_10320 [Chthonomonadaceae bacterium]|nr:hypothetical protein [Chthonomonadaceae bacterium]